jgi:hypothetical protein
MPRFKNPLAHVRVASPCKADWDQMIGSDRVRFCGQCSLNVYNLSAMTRDQAEHLIAANEGRLCVRFYRRNDGSILTRDCPVGLRAVRARVSYWTKAATAALLTFLAATGLQSVISNFHFEPRMTMGTMGSISDPVEDELLVQGGMQLPEPQEPIFMGKAVLKRPPRDRLR